MNDIAPMIRPRLFFAPRAMAVITIAVLASVSSAGTYAQDAPKPRIAVYAPIVADNVKLPSKKTLDPEVLTRTLEEKLRATRRVQVFERDTDVIQGSVAKEQALARSSQSQGDLVAAYATSGLVIQPIIVEYSAGTWFRDVDGLPGMYKRSGTGRLTVTYKVLDAETLEIKFPTTARAKYSGSSQVVKGKKYLSLRPIWNTLVGKVSDQAVVSITDGLFPIQVIRYSDGQIYINRGKGSVELDRVYDLMAAGEALIDPATGENLGSSELALGQVKITRVLPKFSIAQPVSKLDGIPQRGDILRLPR
ncbi:MAG: hypothetical protein ACPGU7_11975 [Gammaproteobacteria bacterium]